MLRLAGDQLEPASPRFYGDRLELGVGRVGIAGSIELRQRSTRIKFNGVIAKLLGRGDRGTDLLPCDIDRERIGWLDEAAEKIAERYRKKELSAIDLIRQYGVIVDWGSGKLLEKTTSQFREMLKRRTVPYWALRKKAAGAKPTLKVA